METPATAQQPVAVDQPCIRCGYSLRGLPASGLCPECATPVERSLHGDMLVFSDPSYVNRLVLAVRLILVSILCIAVLSVISYVLSMAKVSAGQAFHYIYLAAICLFLCGGWILTVPDPGQLTTNKGERPRQVVRASLVAVGAIHLLDTVLRHIALPAMPISLTFIIANYVAMGAGVVAGMRYLRWLAERIPSAKLDQYPRKVMIVVGVILTLQLCSRITFRIVVQMAIASSSSLPLSLMALAGFVIGVGNLIALSMCINLFSLLRKELFAVQLEQSPLGLPSDRGYQDPSTNP